MYNVISFIYTYGDVWRKINFTSSSWIYLLISSYIIANLKYKPNHSLAQMRVPTTLAKK
jgi:hypothetical protein